MEEVATCPGAGTVAWADLASDGEEMDWADLPIHPPISNVPIDPWRWKKKKEKLDAAWDVEWETILHIPHTTKKKKKKIWVPKNSSSLPTCCISSKELWAEVEGLKREIKSLSSQLAGLRDLVSVHPPATQQLPFPPKDPPKPLTALSPPFQPPQTIPHLQPVPKTQTRSHYLHPSSSGTPFRGEVEIPKPRPNSPRTPPQQPKPNLTQISAPNPNPCPTLAQPLSKLKPFVFGAPSTTPKPPKPPSPIPKPSNTSRYHYPMSPPPCEELTLFTLGTPPPRSRKRHQHNSPPTAPGRGCTSTRVDKLINPSKPLDLTLVEGGVSRQDITTILDRAKTLISHFIEDDSLIPEHDCKIYLALHSFLESHRSWVSPSELKNLRLAWGRFSNDLEEWDHIASKAAKKRRKDESWIQDLINPPLPPKEKKGKEKIKEPSPNDLPDDGYFYNAAGYPSRIM